MGNIISDREQLIILEQSLEFALTPSDLSSVSLQIRCCLSDETLIITVSSPIPESLDSQKFLDNLGQILTEQTLCQSAPILVYWLDGEISYYFQDLATLLTANCFKSSCLPKKLEPAFNLQRKNYLDKIKTIRDLVLSLIKNIPQNQKLGSKKITPFLLITGISLGGILGGSYFLSRPCVLSECEIIQEVEQGIKTSVTQLNSSSSEAEMFRTKQDLQQLINSLKSIPWWSSYYTEAQIQQEKYTRELDNLSLIIAANTIQAQLVSLVKNNSISSSQWQKSQEDLSQLISDLETILQTSIFSELAQEKIKISQNLSKYLTQKLSNKEKSEISFNLAKKASQIAKTRGNAAKNLADLTLLISTWKTAIKRLQEIPPETLYYQPSRILLKDYSAQLNQAQKRKNQEELGIKLYEQAREQAKLAEKAQSENQWSQSVSYWNQAIYYLKGIPNHTFQSMESQPLIATYTLALTQAKSQLKLAITSAKILNDLEGICQTPSPVCDYQIEEPIIKIRLTSDYIEQLWNTALQAKVQGNLQIQTELLYHLSSFEYRLQTLSDRTGYSIEVYNAQGYLMAVYQKRQ